MYSPDCLVLADALQWFDTGHSVDLFTVVQTWGSAPRSPGAVLAIRDDGAVSGSVSGGCVEDDLVERTCRAMRSNADAELPVRGFPTLVAYGVTQDEAARFGLPCGGSLRLVQEPFLDPEWARQLLARCADHQLVARTLTLATGNVQLADAVPGQPMQFDGSTLTTVFGPQWRLLLIGAGQLSIAVAQMAALLDFDVLVCDPREEYLATLQARVPDAVHLPGMPDDVVRDMVPDTRTAIVALTHDPKLDDMALLEALKSNAFYVGALGSRLSQQRRKQRLGEHFNMSDAELHHLHGPVGLQLGAKTPAEIAVAIVAEIVQVRNAVPNASRESKTWSSTSQALS